MNISKYARLTWTLGTRFVPMALVLGACGGGIGLDGGADDDTTGLDSGDTTDDGPGMMDPVDNSGSDAGSSVPEAGEPVAPCDPSQTAAIQARLDADAPAGIDAVAFVKDPSCGERYFTRGPSHYPVTTPQVIASNTKMYVASLILLLADDGLLKLDDPIAKWLDKVPGGNAITVRQALNHTSALFNYTENQIFQAQATFGRKFTPQELVNIGFAGKVYDAPGVALHYSNTNYIVLGIIAEKVGGKPVEQQIRERILNPMGAKSTYFHGKEDIPVPVAVGKTASGTNGLYFWDPSTVWCAGAYIATPDDLANFVERRSSGAFHSESANKELFSLVPANGGGYGMGLNVIDGSYTHGGGRAFGHYGDLHGYHSFSSYFPDRKATVVLIVDSDGGPKSGGTYREVLLYSILDPLFGYVPSDDAGATP